MNYILDRESSGLGRIDGKPKFLPNYRVLCNNDIDSGGECAGQTEDR
jgi:hypothetical protein